MPLFIFTLVMPIQGGEDPEKKAVMELIDKQSPNSGMPTLESKFTSWVHEPWVQKRTSNRELLGWEKIKSRYEETAENTWPNYKGVMREKSNLHYKRFDDLAWVTWSQKTVGIRKDDTKADPSYSWEARLVQKVNGEWKIVSQVTMRMEAPEE